MEQTTPENQITYVGVDIAKDRLDYTVDDTRYAHVENTHRGHRALIKHLQSLPNARVVCAATGGYERAIVAALLLAQIQVCVVKSRTCVRLCPRRRLCSPRPTHSTLNCCAALGYK
ncbi:MAG: transposase [Candidatus Synoicihabitans palmerolidicus]|nr:transposase [Candidatus Synoicihabitans palmerolidicus]MCC5024306.1 transposase [Candidatus Synoicihabitans palmerolidicus]MCC5024599.1 transposase [Candidatus Synoicihabitans palmerolidicus]